MNLSLFWDINHIAAHTGWAHPVMAVFALWGWTGPAGHHLGVHLGWSVWPC